MFFCRRCGRSLREGPEGERGGCRWKAKVVEHEWMWIDSKDDKPQGADKYWVLVQFYTREVYCQKKSLLKMPQIAVAGSNAAFLQPGEMNQEKRAGGGEIVDEPEQWRPTRGKASKRRAHLKVEMYVSGTAVMSAAKLGESMALLERLGREKNEVSRNDALPSFSASYSSARMLLGFTASISICILSTFRPMSSSLRGQVRKENACLDRVHTSFNWPLLL